MVQPIALTVAEVAAIVGRLPLRYPFVLVDRILRYERGASLHALKNVTFNEPFFLGHFPGYPVMPGVLVVEALAQLACVLALLSREGQRGVAELVFLDRIDAVRFKRQVFPGDQLLLEVETVRVAADGGVFATRARVEGELATEAELSIAIRRGPERRGGQALIPRT